MEGLRAHCLVGTREGPCQRAAFFLLPSEGPTADPTESLAGFPLGR